MAKTLGRIQKNNLQLAGEVISSPASSYLQFDGGTNYIDCGATDLNLQTMTIEALIKVSSPSDTFQTIVCKGAGGYTNFCLDIDVSGNLRFFSYVLGGSSGAAGILDANAVIYITDNIEHLVSATFDGSNWKLYVDGVLKKTVYGAITTQTSTQAIQIGARQGTSFLGGIIREVRIWNVAKTIEEINMFKNIHLSGNEEGLAGYWIINQGFGKKVYDLSKSRNDGAIRGTITWQREEKVETTGKTSFLAAGNVECYDISEAPSPTFSRLTAAISNDGVIAAGKPRFKKKNLNLMALDSRPVASNDTGSNLTVTPYKYCGMDGYRITISTFGGWGAVMLWGILNGQLPDITATYSFSIYAANLNPKAGRTARFRFCNAGNQNLAINDMDVVLERTLKRFTYNNLSVSGSYVQKKDTVLYLNPYSSFTDIFISRPQLEISSTCTPFSEGLYIEEDTTNLFNGKLIATDSVKGGYNGWLRTGIGNDNPITYIDSVDTPVLASATYTFSCLYWSSNNMVGDVYLRFNDTGWPSSDYFIKIFLHGSDIRIKDLGNGWKQCSASFTTHSTTTKITEVRFDADAAGVNVFIANVQLEQKSYATSYTDGTRGNETLSVPADGIISREQGTVEMVIQTLMPQTAMTAQRRFFWSWGTDGTNAGLDCVQGNGKFYFRNYYTPGSAQQAMYTIPANFENAPHYLAFTWSASKGTMKLYLDGIAVATATYGIQDNLVQPKIGIGCLNGSGFPVSSIISDFRISAIDRTDAEITVINNSGNFLPLPIDGMTTMKLEVENGIANPIIPFRMYADGTLQVTELVEQVNL